MIEFEVNNQRKIRLEQQEQDKDVNVTVWAEQIDGIREVEEEYAISPGDFVMLLNWYRYQKENGNTNLSF